MPVRLIATDLDGTLLNSQGQVSDYTRQIFWQAQQQGVRIVLATGRSLSAIASIRQALHTDLYPENFYIALNGGLLHPCDGSAEEYAPGLPLFVVEKLLNTAQKLDLEVLCYTIDARWRYLPPGFSARRLDYLRRYGLTQEENAEHLLGETLSLDSPHCLPAMEPCIKVALLHSSRRLREVLPQIQSVCGSYGRALMVTPSWMEVIPADVDKGAALQKIMHRCGVTPSEAAAFGDGENDLGMLRAVEYGYAMKNAFPQVQAAAQYHAPPNTEDGVAQVVKILCGL